MFTEIIILLGDIEEYIDEFGDVITKRKERKIFGRKDRIYTSETLESMAQGFKKQARFRISDYYDYKNEEFLKYKDEIYKIINIQEIGTELEINCVGGVEDGRS